MFIVADDGIGGPRVATGSVAARRLTSPRHLAGAEATPQDGAMRVLFLVLVGLGVACWISATIHWLMLFAHRKPDVSAARLIFSGMSAFNADNFTPSGHPIQRRMLLSMLGFALFVVAGMAGQGMLAQ